MKYEKTRMNSRNSFDRILSSYVPTQKSMNSYSNVNIVRRNSFLIAPRSHHEWDRMRFTYSSIGGLNEINTIYIHWVREGKRVESIGFFDRQYNRRLHTD